MMTWPFSNSTLNIAFGRVSVITPSSSIADCFGMFYITLKFNTVFDKLKGRQLLSPTFSDNNRQFEMR